MMGFLLLCWLSGAYVGPLQPSEKLLIYLGSSMDANPVGDHAVPGAGSLESFVRRHVFELEADVEPLGGDLDDRELLAAPAKAQVGGARQHVGVGAERA